MQLDAFAKLCGVVVSEGPEGFGHGRIQYTTADHPNSHVCGFSSERAAHMHWLKATFGDQAAKAVLKLLKQTEKTKCKLPIA